ncbi:hypothetical protein ACPCSP_25445 [Streptomyces cinereoruber]|uniref:hypothetical protein n=1 Tax=Streptomyces cinereoruber TaxID=67260 RepID=UPI003C2C8515
MNTPRPARPQAPPGVALQPGTAVTDWCALCKAWTRQTVALLLLTVDGVAPAGSWSWCEIHDDPDSPLPPRRIDRA